MKATHLTILYVESLSEGEFWLSSDEEHAELFEQMLEGAYHGRLSSELRLDLAERTSLLLLDKTYSKRKKVRSFIPTLVNEYLYIYIIWPYIRYKHVKSLISAFQNYDHWPTLHALSSQI